ncbi:MAG: hypothetical protein J1F28_06460 [Oscillospiraceae bacterium]|nr:hypothetical protein [Oscillospiraceae bacterium]
MNKKTKIKIKRSKVNLYNKRKSKTRQIVAIVITAVAACGLCILGYGIGKPLMDFFRNRGSVSSESSWTPDSSLDSESSSGEISSSSEESSAPAVIPAPVMTKSAYYLSEEAALSSASLNSELAAAKAAGHSVVVATLKDSDGFFLYKTSIEKAESRGTLSAAQIAAEIEKAGFIPAAKISTIKDKTNGVALDCNYKFADGSTWIDGYPGTGKTWISPFDTKALEFVKSITAELSQAGFKRIIAAETMVPVFFKVDITTNLAHLPLSDRTARAEALWNVIAAAEEGAKTGGAELYIEMDGAGLILEKKDGTDAELAFTTAPLKTANIIVNYSPASSADNAYSAAKDFIESLNEALDGAECIVRIRGSFSATVLSDVKKAFDEAGIEAFSQ